MKPSSYSWRNTPLEESNNSIYLTGLHQTKNLLNELPIRNEAIHLLLDAEINKFVEIEKNGI